MENKLSISGKAKIILNIECLEEEEICARIEEDYSIYEQFNNFIELFRFIAVNMKNIEKALEYGYDIVMMIEDKEYGITMYKDGKVAMEVNLGNIVSSECKKFYNALKEIEKIARENTWG